MQSRLTLVTSDSPAILMERLSSDLGRDPLPPFEDEVIVVHNYGMQRWVKQELARRHGCAASLQLDFPGKFCRDMATRLTGDRGATDPRFTREAMTWRILDLLEEGVADDPNFVALHRYLTDADTRKRLGLAARAATCLDDYQLYRPDALARWEEGAPSEEEGVNERWQHALWRHLCATQAPQETFSRWMDNASTRLEECTDAPPGLPRRVSVFGISTLTPHVVRLLRALASFVPVTIYVLAPPSSGWATNPPRNPLFAAFGAGVRELISLLGDDIAHEEIPAPAPARMTCLERLRDDMRQGHARGRGEGMLGAVPLDPADDSLTVHVCHSPMREMEVLRDQILAAFAADPTLRPHDVLILVPDTTTYAPLVEAVFDVGEPELPRIPHRVADRPIVHESSLAAAMLRIIQLAGARWTVPEILELLDVEAVRRAAGISERGARAILQWIEETRIRWGRDGATRKSAFDLPAIETNTWRAGIDRLLMGYATGKADDVVGSVLPHAGDTIGDAATLGAFAHWLDRLFETLDEWRTPRPLSGWRTVLRAAVDTFLEPEGDDEERAHDMLLRAIDTLGDAETNGGCRRPIDLAVVRDWIERSLSDEMMTGGFLTGGMVVAALKPMRAIPFRVIAIAGLDDESFPRKDRRAAYDLLAAEHRPGDHDRRMGDRQLFLDTILSATDRLILSYVGRSARDNSERAPSVVLAQLLDIVDASFTHPAEPTHAARDAIEVQHRLQPFSPEYYGGKEPRLFSFSRANARATAIMLGDRIEDVPFVTGALPTDPSQTGRLEIGLADLIDCWTNPSRFFCKRVLELHLSSDEDEATDCEPMSVNGLVKYGISSDIVRCHLAGARSLERERARATLVGDLPSGALGALWFGRIDAELQDFLNAVGEVRFAEPAMIDVQGASWRITGCVDRLTPNGRLELRPTRRKPKDLIRAWITHLVSCASQTSAETTIVALDCTTRMSCEPNALALLDDFVAGYRAALRAPLPVFEGASWSYVDRVLAQERGARVTRSALEQAQDAFRVNEFNGRRSGDLTDAHVELCWRGRSPFDDAFDDFHTYSEGLWRPIFARIEDAPLGVSA